MLAAVIILVVGPGDPNSCACIGRGLNADFSTDQLGAFDHSSQSEVFVCEQIPQVEIFSSVEANPVVIDGQVYFAGVNPAENIDSSGFRVANCILTSLLNNAK